MSSPPTINPATNRIQSKYHNCVTNLHLQAEDLAKELGNAPYVECSALTGQGLQEMMQAAITQSLSAGGASKGADAKKDKKCCILVSQQGVGGGMT